MFWYSKTIFSFEEQNVQTTFQIRSCLPLFRFVKPSHYLISTGEKATSLTQKCTTRCCLAGQTEYVHSLIVQSVKYILHHSHSLGYGVVSWAGCSISIPKTTKANSLISTPQVLFPTLSVSLRRRLASSGDFVSQVDRELQLVQGGFCYVICISNVYCVFRVVVSAERGLA